MDLHISNIIDSLNRSTVNTAPPPFRYFVMIYDPVQPSTLETLIADHNTVRNDQDP